MNFKLTLWKSIGSIIGGVIINFLLSSTIKCRFVGGECPTTFEWMYSGFGITITIITILVIYIIWSLFENKK